MQDREKRSIAPRVRASGLGIVTALIVGVASAGTLSVGGGTADIPPGTVITLTAAPPSAGEVFDRWTGDTAGIADVTSPVTTMTMPAGNVSVQASYKPDPSLPPAPPTIPPLAQVMPAMETAGASDPDDMWLWRHPTSPGDSIVIAADKGRSRVRWYDLSGAQLGTLGESGRPNNVDGRGDLLACSLRNAGAIGLYRVDAATRSISKVGSFPLGFEPYGVCMYQSPVSGKLYVFTSEYDSDVFQYEVNPSTYAGTLVRVIDTAKVEGLAAHDASRRLFYAEESRSLCAIDAEPDPAATRTVIGTVGSNNLSPDLEGVALVGDLYVIVSVQGRSEFAVFEMRAPTYYYRGRFEVRRLSGTIDSVSGTDGIDWHGGDFGGSFRSGIFLCHDSSNGWGQNIKAVPWERIASELGLTVP